MKYSHNMILSSRNQILRRVKVYDTAYHYLQYDHVITHGPYHYDFGPISLSAIIMFYNN
jgi:hypothetical protein